MKKVLFASLFGTIACCAAMASDGGVYTETETYTTREKMNYDVETYYVPAPVRPAPSRVIIGRRADTAKVARPCARYAGEPVHVKTYTEVVDHYQVYQPVMVYEPIGSYSERQVIEAPRCNRCNG